MVSLIQNYRTVDGFNITHVGMTSVVLFQFSENSVAHSRIVMEGVWAIDEVDFNIKGLSMDCIFPLGDLKKEDKSCGLVTKFDLLLIGLVLLKWTPLIWIRKIM